MAKNALGWLAPALLLLAVGCTPPAASTTLYVNPASGADSNDGSHFGPLATLTAALSRAGDGWTIYLADGIYEESTGEVWPLQSGFPPTATPNVPTGVTIVGSGGGAVLSGPGGSTAAAALVFEGAATVRGLELRFFERALLASNPGELRLEDLTAHSNSVDGLLAYGLAEVVAHDSVFRDNSLSGVAAFGDASLVVEGGRLSGNRTGAYLADDSVVRLEGVEIASNGASVSASHAGVYAVGESVVEVIGAYVHQNSGAGVEASNGAKVTVLASTLELNYHGVYAAGETTNAIVTVAASQVVDGYVGIRWGGVGGALYVRGTVVSGNQSDGVLIGGQPAVIDLGNAATLGDNDLSGNLSHQLYDQRAARAAADGPIITVTHADIVHDVVLCASLAPPGVYIGPAYITCDGNVILAIESANNRVRLLGD